MGSRRFHRTRRFLDTYTRDMRAEDLQRLFTREAPDAYRFFARGIDPSSLAGLPWHRRAAGHLRLLFLAFTLKLSPARRALYGVALVTALVGLVHLLRGVAALTVPLLPFFFISLPVPVPVWSDGTWWLLTGFLLMNLLVLLEVADRLSLKRDLEIAREIQQAMLPAGTYRAPGVEAFGLTRPANTVGGDFYDILPLADGRVLAAVGDVAGKGSPAALLMALLLAILRTLVEEELDPAELVERLNVQIARHAPPSRFITLFLAFYDPANGSVTYVNAGQTPPLLRRRDGTLERLTEGGVALGMFALSRYQSGQAAMAPGDLLVLYSDGITEAEDPRGRPFDEAGLERAIGGSAADSSREIGSAVVKAVEAHAQDTRFADDLTILVLRRLAPVADGVTVAAT